MRPRSPRHRPPVARRAGPRGGPAGTGPRGRKGRGGRRWVAGVMAALVLAGATTGCAGRNGRNDTDPVPGEPSPARGNVPPDDPAERPAP